MGRIARVVAQGLPHHITQRGNGRQVVFDDAKDRRVYLKLLQGYAEEYRLRVWAWCLMSNHVHLLAVPETSESLKRSLGQTHADYARYRNAQLATCGHLWQCRYYSCPVDEAGVWRVMTYIERNPVRAGLVDLAEDYAWSSARAHLADHDRDGFLDMQAWRASYDAERWAAAGNYGRQALWLFIEQLERDSHRMLRPAP